MRFIGLLESLKTIHKGLSGLSVIKNKELLGLLTVANTEL